MLIYAGYIKRIMIMWLTYFCVHKCGIGYVTHDTILRLTGQKRLRSPDIKSRYKMCLSQ